MLGWFRHKAWRLPGPSFWAAMVLQLGLGIALAFTPLLNLLGYEFCVAVSLLCSLTAGPVAIGVARRRPAALDPSARPGGVIAGLYGRAVMLNGITLSL